MAEAGFLDPKPIRPGAVAMVVLLHGAAIAALLLIKNPEVIRDAITRTKVVNVTIPPAPPPEPAPQPEQPRQQVQTYTVPPLPTPARNDRPVVRDPAPQPPIRDVLPGRVDVAGPVLPPQRPVVQPDPPPPPPREIVRTEARMTSGSELQPPYPTAEQRLEREGRVVIQVTIGADGRVKAAQKVSATSDAFYTATERHARSRWRFRPGTVDGRPVEATKTLTVVFQLDA